MHMIDDSNKLQKTCEEADRFALLNQNPKRQRTGSAWLIPITIAAILCEGTGARLCRLTTNW